MAGLYLLGILVESWRHFCITELFFQGRSCPVCHGTSQLPAAGARNVGQLVGKSKRFPAESVFIILLASMIIWFLQSFDLHLNLVKDSADSIRAMVAESWHLYLRTNRTGRLENLVR